MNKNISKHINWKENIFKPMIAFFVVLILLFSLMLLVNTIPRSTLQKGIDSSAEYYSSFGIRRNWIGNLEQSKEDIYADAVLMNIIACMEPGIENTISAKYYEAGDYMGQNLLAVTNGAEANTEYSRYWHGTVIPVTLMLMVTDANGIRIINALILGVLVLAFMYMCKRCEQNILAIGYLIGFVLTQSYFVPLSIEYMSCYVISIIASIIALYINEDKLIYLFLLTGLCTSFFDFLTVETMTLLLPLISWLAVAKKQRREYKFLHKTAKYSIIWLIGYGGAFVCKWILSTAFLGSSAVSEVAIMGSEKFIKDIPANVGLGRYGAAIFHNLAGLVPTTLTSTYIGITSVILVSALIVFSFWFLFRGQRLNKSIAISLVCIAIVPYIRYLALPYHAYMHSFFTYRAQLVTILSIFLLVAWTIDPVHLHLKRRRK